jgi:hypothetical protein
MAWVRAAAGLFKGRHFDETVTTTNYILHLRKCYWLKWTPSSRPFFVFNKIMVGEV